MVLFMLEEDIRVDMKQRRFAKYLPNQLNAMEFAYYVSRSRLLEMDIHTKHTLQYKITA